MKLNATYRMICGTARSMAFWATYGKVDDVADDAFREATYRTTLSPTYWTTYGTTERVTGRVTRDAIFAFLKGQS